MQRAGSLTRRLHLRIQGRVQGIGFRWFARETAERYGIAGWIRNLPDGSVEAQAQGSAEQLSGFIDELKSGHPYARVESVERRAIALQTSEGEFIVR